MSAGPWTNSMGPIQRNSDFPFQPASSPAPKGTPMNRNEQRDDEIDRLRTELDGLRTELVELRQWREAVIAAYLDQRLSAPAPDLPR